MGPLVTFAGKKFESTEQLIEEIFEEIDPSGEGKITLDQYRTAAKSNPDITQGLKLFSD